MLKIHTYIAHLKILPSFKDIPMQKLPLLLASLLVMSSAVYARSPAERKQLLQETKEIHQYGQESRSNLYDHNQTLKNTYKEDTKEERKEMHLDMKTCPHDKREMHKEPHKAKHKDKHKDRAKHKAKHKDNK